MAQDLDGDDIQLSTSWLILFHFTTKKHAWILAGAVSTTLLCACTIPIQSILLGLLFNQLVNFGSGAVAGAVMMAKISKYCTYVTLLGTVSWFGHALYFALWMTFGELQARSARNRIFDNLLGRDIAWYDLRKSGTGAFLSKVQMQIREFQLANSQPMGETLQAVFTGIVALSIALYFSWDLTLITLCPIPFVFLLIAKLGSRTQRNIHRQAEKLEEALKYVINAMQSIEMVKCFNGEESELSRFSKTIKHAATFYVRQANLQAFEMGAMQFVTVAMFVQGFWYGSSLVFSGKKNPGQIMTAFMAALMALQSVQGFLPNLIVMEKGRAAGAQLRLLFAEESRNSGRRMGRPTSKMETCVGDIVLKEVSFAYPARPQNLALCDATMSFAAGQTTFVIGRSGSGKSTIGQLLVRFYEPSRGEIRIGGQLLAEIDPDSLRDNVTLVEQHSVLFNDTIFGNIALANRGMETVSLAEVKEAAQFAMLQQMISDLPDGYNTKVGSKGNTMSGGQRQRMALARTRLRNTPILVLDESTSALDYISRSLVLDAIRTWRQGKTTIIITHDIAQIGPDDYVYVLDKSRVIQQGRRSFLERDYGSPFSTFHDSKEGHQLYADPIIDDASMDILQFYEDSRRPPTNLIQRNAVPSQSRSRPASTYSNLPGQRTSMLLPMGSPFLFSPGEVSNSTRTSFAATPNDPRVSYLDIMSLYAADSSYRRRSTSDDKRLTIVDNVQSVIVDPSRLPHEAGMIEEIPLGEITIQTNEGSSPATWSEESSVQIKRLSMLHVLRTVWPQLDWICRGALLTALVAAVVHAAATPAFSFVLAKLLSTFYIQTDRSQLALLYSLTILGIAIIDGIATYSFHFLSEYCAQVWVNNIKLEAMRRLLHQPREFYDKSENTVPKIGECLDHFAEETRNILGRFAGIVLVVLVMLGIAIVWSMIQSWKVTLVILATAPVLYAITTSTNAICSKWERHSNNADESIGTVLHETLVNIRTVRSLTLEKPFRTKYVQATRQAFRVGMKRGIYSGIFSALNYSAIFYTTAFLFWYCGRVLSSGEFSMANIVAVLNILLLSISYANAVIGYMPQIGHAKDAAARLFRLVNLPQDSHEREGNVRISSVGDISLKGVDFAYPSRPSSLALKDIHLNIAAGSCTAIVGMSGSGKSTIASLIMKLYQAKSCQGERTTFTISDCSIDRIHTPTLRSHIAIVSQTPAFCAGTIAENIAYGFAPGSALASFHNICTAASAAGIHEFIESLPSGYRTNIGDGGMGLSGGQAQRIAIARALVRKPDVLILDEATSALDVESAGMIRDTIRDLVLHQSERITQAPTYSDGRGPGTGQQGMTVIIITHSREMMAVAEKVVMLDQGKIVEEGTFEELKRRRGGEFATLLAGGAWDESEDDQNIPGKGKTKAEDISN